jgi:lipopolysaccharide biosynthesis protein
MADGPAEARSVTGSDAPFRMNGPADPDPPARRPRMVAFYLPQYHPIPENDEWWGRGFTEWTNAARARPLFKGHYQPHVPADLGFYDLRLPEIRAAQAEMAREHGIEAFCYYHYWFAGKRLLERPFNEVLASGEPDFPFCLCWANQTWTGIWHNAPNRILVEQTYPGMEDHRRHFEALLPAFHDRRYLQVDGKPLFLVYAPGDLPESPRVLDFWRELASKSGLPGIFFVAEHWRHDWDPKPFGYDAAVTVNQWKWRYRGDSWDHPIRKIGGKIDRWRGRPKVYLYREVIDSLVADRVPGIENFPCVIPNWDNTPRSGRNGLVFHESTPEDFRRHLRRALDRTVALPQEHRLVFVKSWNEWAEGNHLEPDLKYGRRYLEVIHDELHKYK